MEPKPNTITFTRKKQPPQVMLACRTHTQGGRTKLSFTTEVAARQPSAFLAPPARQEHTGPDQLLQLSKIPVAGSSHHLISNKKTLVSQQDMTKQTALPLAPVTIASKRPIKIITPMTHPEDSSSDSGASWSTPSSSGASSYQPSSNSSRWGEEADDVIDAEAGQPAAAKQAIEFTKVLDRWAKPSTPAFIAGKPPAYQAKSTAPQLPATTSKGIAEMVQGKQGACQAEGPAEPAVKRQRIGKAILTEAEVHVTNAAVKGADAILVEMPADFDIAGDAGSIGRFALQPRNSRAAMQMDIKAGGGGSATVEMATNVYLQASTIQTGHEHTDCSKEWSDAENECFEPCAATFSKAKVTKPKAKRKPRTKVAAKMN
ncbi:TPA: hypothetical protein ACH3X1_009078 [Trebouxia sp. C0004]